MNISDAISVAQRYAPTALNRGGSQVDSGLEQDPAPSSAPAGYISPRVRFDRETKLLVIEIRDVQNGEVQQSFPSKSTVEAYQRAARTGALVPGVPEDVFRSTTLRNTGEGAPEPKPEVKAEAPVPAVPSAPVPETKAAPVAPAPAAPVRSALAA